MTQLDRTEIFSYLGEKLHKIKLENGRNIAPMKLYTSEPTPQLKGIKNMGEVHYMYEMPLVFKYSKNKSQHHAKKHKKRNTASCNGYNGCRRILADKLSE